MCDLILIWNDSINDSIYLNGREATVLLRDTKTIKSYTNGEFIDFNLDLYILNLNGYIYRNKLSFMYNNAWLYLYLFIIM
jgi:hypothetical protein